ncbi:MAG: glycosyltransferase family 2 protein [Candidatus Saccharimonadales bacterium]
MNISIVIPVYNEADHLSACLKAIEKQTIKPHEVIVVDNNSTDNSLAIINSFPFVTILSEPKQGVVHARNCGFNAAVGDIIARIDADTVVEMDWLENIQTVFQADNVDAVSGIAHYYSINAAVLFNKIDLFFRRRLSRQLGDRVFLWGANMALKRSAWQSVSPILCNIGGIHEDFDLAIHLQEIGFKIQFVESIIASVSSRRIDTNFIDFMKYVLVSPSTYAKHGVKARWHMYVVVGACGLGYLPARIMHVGYDSSTDRFSFYKLLFSKPISSRVDPTINVA